jgi:hypothetical protein
MLTLKRSQFLGVIVYKIYNETILLYVGFSGIGLTRALSHNFIDQATHVEIEYFKDEKSAHLREQELIKTLDPVFNKVFNFDKDKHKYCRACNKVLLKGRRDRIFCSSNCRASYFRLVNSLTPMTKKVVENLLRAKANGEVIDL